MTRLVVAGGGITGSACALAAARLGASVTLVSAADPGTATRAGAGIISPWRSSADDPHRHALSCAGAAAYPALIESLAAAGQTATGYRRTGALIVTEMPERAAEIAGQLLAGRARWPDMGEVGALAPGGPAGLFPPLRPDLAGVLVSGGARVDGRAVCAALRRAAQRSGAGLVAGRAQLRIGPSGVRGVSVDGRLIGADAVVAAAGAWTDEFLAPARVVLGVTPQRGQIVHLDLPGAGTGGWPTVSRDGSGHYLLGFEDARVVAGATRETGAGFDHRVTAGGLAEVLSQALAVAPGLAGATHLQTRVGFRPAGPDSRPVLGPVPGVPGLVVATGLGAAGLTMGPLAGELAARAALGLELPLDLTPFDPARAIGLARAAAANPS